VKTTYTSAKLPEIYMKRIVCLHGVPTAVFPYVVLGLIGGEVRRRGRAMGCGISKEDRGGFSRGELDLER
jgi:hypothetical protein